MLLNILLNGVGLDFDRRTGTTTCRQLLASLSGEDLAGFLGRCYRLFLQPQANGTGWKRR